MAEKIPYELKCRKTGEVTIFMADYIAHYPDVEIAVRWEGTSPEEKAKTRAELLHTAELVRDRLLRERGL